MSGFRLEKLDVWHRAVDFANRIYAVTRSFPADERFGLTSQLQRAAVSISSNIAEGSSRRSDTDYAGFIKIAYGSLMEVVSQLHVAQRQDLLPAEDFKSLLEESERLSRMPGGFMAGLRRSKRSPRTKETSE